MIIDPQIFVFWSKRNYHPHWLRYEILFFWQDSGLRAVADVDLGGVLHGVDKKQGNEGEPIPIGSMYGIFTIFTYIWLIFLMFFT